MKNELRRHQRGDKIKWIIAFAAILLLIGGVTMICMQLFTPYKPSNGFKKAETATTQAVGVGVKRANIKPGIFWLDTDKSGTFTATITCSDETNFSVTRTFNYQEQSETHEAYGQTVSNSRVVITANLSDLREQGYGNFVWTSPSGVSAETSSKWILGHMYQEKDFTNAALTCEKVWSTVPLPEAPTKEGYTFTGWYTDEACTQKYEGETVREDVTLYAGWEINTYTVTYDSNGGSACESVTVNWNTAPTLPTTTRIGYTFLGWFDGDTQYTDAPVKENKTLTAHWEILTFTVTFMSDGQVYKTMTVEYGTSLTDVMATNELAVYNVVAYSGLTMAEDGTELEVTADAEVEIQPATGWDKTVKYVKANWIWLTVCVAGAAVVIGIVAALASHSGKRRYRR